MRRLFTIALLALAFTVGVPAQTIHWITFIDTSDWSLGEVNKNGRKVLYADFIDVVNKALLMKGYRSKKYDFYGNRTTPENCKQLIEKFSCSPDDIIMFYYIGHGVRPALGDDYDLANPWPQFCMAQINEKKFIPMHWIHQELKSKGARLVVTIGMCCNTRYSKAKHKDEPKFRASANKTLNDNYAKRIQNWFLNYKGDIEVSSASPKQRSITYEFQEMGVTDLFTGAVVSTMQQNSYKASAITWDSFLRDVKRWCNSLSDQEQTPYYRTNITLVK